MLAEGWVLVDCRDAVVGLLLLLRLTWPLGEDLRTTSVTTAAQIPTTRMAPVTIAQIGGPPDLRSRGGPGGRGGLGGMGGCADQAGSGRCGGAGGLSGCCGIGGGSWYGTDRWGTAKEVTVGVGSCAGA